MLSEDTNLGLTDSGKVKQPLLWVHPVSIHQMGISLCPVIHFTTYTENQNLKQKSM